MARPDKSLKILIVDDKNNMRRTIRNLLRKIGYEDFVEADDGDTALTKLRTHDIDLVLCDWNMPRMNGGELLKAVRDNDDLKDLPFLMITAEANEATVAEAGEVDVDGYILKPFTPKLIQEKIEKVLEARATPSPLETHLSVGQVFVKSKQYERAREEFQAALRINPNSPRALLAMGQLEEVQGNVKKAQGLLEQAVKLSPNFLKARKALIKLYQARGDLKNAAEHLRAAVRISPRNVDSQVEFGRVLILTDRTEEAHEVFGRVIKLSQDDLPETARQIGEIYLEAGLEAQAEGVFLQGLATNPNDIHLYNRLGIAYRKQSKFQEAVENYQAALKIAPDNEKLLYNLGRAFFEADDRDRSEAAMRRALKLDPEFTEAEEFLTKVLKKTL